MEFLLNEKIKTSQSSEDTRSFRTKSEKNNKQDDKEDVSEIKTRHRIRKSNKESLSIPREDSFEPSSERIETGEGYIKAEIEKALKPVKEKKRMYKKQYIETSEGFKVLYDKYQKKKESKRFWKQLCLNKFNEDRIPRPLFKINY